MSFEHERSIVWVDIPCRDLDRAIAFYEAVLGREVSRQGDDTFAMGILPHAGMGTGACLAVLDDTEPSAKGPLVYLDCNGRLDQAIAAAVEHGGQILRERHSIGPHGERAIVLDSEGNRIALHSG